MASFLQALAAENRAAAAAGPSTSTRNHSITNGAPAGRALASALRGAGIANQTGMEVDGAAGKPIRGAAARKVTIRSAGPMDQTGRQRSGQDKSYSNNTKVDRNGASLPRGRGVPNTPALNTPTVVRQQRQPLNLNKQSHRRGHDRAPAGTPPILKDSTVNLAAARKAQHSKLNELVRSEEMKVWIQGRMIAPGVMDFSNLPNDEWLKSHGIAPLGSKESPESTGTLLWRLVDDVIQKPLNTPIHTLSLENNNFHDLVPLGRLALSLTHLRAVNLSNNPITSEKELDKLLARGEQKGKATAGVGSLKGLIELKLVGCLFREQMLSMPDGPNHYQHEILRRFPGLRILDGENLNRVVFPIERKPKVLHSEAQRKVYADKPFTFPLDVQSGFVDTELVKSLVMSFHAKFFPLFDTDRSALLPAYAPQSTISISSNSLKSRSFLADQLEADRTRPNAGSFDKWNRLPTRNLVFGSTTIQQRMRTLKSPMVQAELLRWWSDVPKTEHPLTEADKWCFDSWILDGEGEKTRLCAVVQGQFMELPSRTYRSFSRTFILAAAPAGSAAQSAGWPAIILSDSLTVSTYLSSGAFDHRRSLAVHGVTISPPVMPLPSTTAAIAPRPTAEANQEALVAQLSQRTGMNLQWSAMCLGQNGWEIEVAMKNFEEIKATIPAEAFQR